MRGLADYEARWDCDTPLLARPRPDCPLWTGAALGPGQRLLLQAEQGFGDTLQMLRYLPAVLAAGGGAGEVVVEVQPELRTLLAPVFDTLPGARLITTAEARPPVGRALTLMSLPRVFSTTLATIPPPARLTVPEEARRRWEERWPAELAPATGPLVGVVWAGNPGHTNDRDRSVPLALFQRVIGAAPGAVVALQPQLRPGDAALLEGLPNLRDLRGLLTDFAETAALILRLDLVITVDSAVAHLAGTLGRPVWLLLPFAPDWRWLRGRADSPWYPGMRLFRQAAPGAWAPVVERVAAALRARA